MQLDAYKNYQRKQWVLRGAAVFAILLVLWGLISILSGKNEPKQTASEPATSTDVKVKKKEKKNPPPSQGEPKTYGKPVEVKKPVEKKFKAANKEPKLKFSKEDEPGFKREKIGEATSQTPIRAADPEPPPAVFAPTPDSRLSDEISALQEEVRKLRAELNSKNKPETKPDKKEPEVDPNPEPTPTPTPEPTPTPSPTAEPTSTPSPTPPSGEIIWNGDFSSGDLSQYKLVQHCAPDRSQVLDASAQVDPVKAPGLQSGAGVFSHVLKFTVHDSDVAPCTPTHNPRAQALSPSILADGGEYWIGRSVFIPSDFPESKLDGDNWVSLGSIYGPPFGKGPGCTGGAGPNGYGSIDATDPSLELYVRRNEFGGFKTAYETAMPRGQWVHQVVHMKMSRDPNVGFREQWLNTGSGWQPQLLEGKPRLMLATLDPTNDDAPNHSSVSLYRRKGMFPTATVYFAAHRIGTSFDAVKPVP